MKTIKEVMSKIEEAIYKGLDTMKEKKGLEILEAMSKNIPTTDRRNVILKNLHMIITQSSFMHDNMSITEVKEMAQLDEAFNGIDPSISLDILQKAIDLNKGCPESPKDEINMNFGDAFIMAKVGHKIKRKEWNNNFLRINDLGNVLLLYYVRKESILESSYIPTNEDIMATDWEVA